VDSPRTRTPPCDHRSPAGRHVLRELENEGIAAELVGIGGRTVRGCTDCRSCFENTDRRCVLDDDILDDCSERMIAADGVIPDSPVYFLDVAAEMKVLIDRAGVVARAHAGLFRRKVAPAAAAVRRSGANHIVDTMLHILLYSGMIVASAPVMWVGTEIKDVLRHGGRPGCSRRSHPRITRRRAYEHRIGETGLFLAHGSDEDRYPGISPGNRPRQRGTVDVTRPEAKERPLRTSEDDLLVICVPVYM
jgi:multimeric flavodoxin WrbA